MFKLLVVLAVAVACVSAAPGALVAAPYVAPVVTAHSSQVIARNYNGLAAPLVAAPVAAPLIAGPAVVKAAPYVASPYVASPYASPYVASPYVASPYVASPYVASPYIGAPAAVHAAHPYYL